ncbi:MAG: DUF2336 domain-containing protein [Hyphomicrobiales bacterium]
MQDARSCLIDLQKLAATGKDQARGDLLHRVTDLFFATADRQSASDMAVFGDVMERIAFELEVEARARFSRRMATADKAPHQLILRLANDEIGVSAPVIEHSPCLTDDDLISIAARHGQDHMRAIANRKSLSRAVTDVILEMGDDTVLTNMASNESASFSPRGFKRLSKRAEENGKLLNALGDRSDVPAAVLEDIKATVARRLSSELAGEGSGLSAERVKEMVASKAANLDLDVFERSSAQFQEFMKNDLIDEGLLRRFARGRRPSETVQCLALLGDIDIGMAAHCLLKADVTALAVLCKSLGFENNTFSSLLQLRTASSPVSGKTIAEAMRHYDALDKRNAEETMRQVRARLTEPGAA